MALPTDTTELKTMKDALIEAGANLNVALPAAVEAFAERGEWTNETAGSWVAQAKAKHPEFWIKPPTEADLANAELEKQAFTGKGNATARAKLVKAVGEDDANERARKYGLRNVGDFARRGIAPVTDDDKNKDTKPDAAKNPWVLPPDDPEGIARRNGIIRSLGTRVASELARAAGKDIAARPLRA